MNEIKQVLAFGVPLDMRQAVEAAFVGLTIQFPTLRLALDGLRARMGAPSETCLAFWESVEPPLEFVNFAKSVQAPVARLAPSGPFIQARSKKDLLTPLGFRLAPKTSSILLPNSLAQDAKLALRAYLDAHISIVQYANHPDSCEIPRDAALIVADEVSAPFEAQDNRGQSYLNLIKTARREWPGKPVVFVVNGDINLEPAIIEEITREVDAIDLSRFSARMLTHTACLYVNSSWAGLDGRLHDIPVHAEATRLQSIPESPLAALQAELLDQVRYIHPVTLTQIGLLEAIDLARDASQLLATAPSPIPIQWRLSDKILSGKRAVEANSFIASPNVQYPQIVKLKAPAVASTTTPAPKLFDQFILPDWVAPKSSALNAGAVICLDNDRYGLPDGLASDTFKALPLGLVGEAEEATEIEKLARTKPSTFLRLLRSRISAASPKAAILRRANLISTRLFARACRSEGVPVIFVPITTLPAGPLRSYADGAAILADHFVAWHPSHNCYFSEKNIAVENISTINLTVRSGHGDCLVVSVTGSWPKTAGSQDNKLSFFIENMIKITSIFNTSTVIYLNSNALKQLSDLVIKEMMTSPHVEIEIIGAELTDLKDRISHSCYLIADSLHPFAIDCNLPSHHMIVDPSGKGGSRLPESFKTLTAWLEGHVPEEILPASDTPSLDVAIQSCIDAIDRNGRAPLHQIFHRRLGGIVLAPPSTRVVEAKALGAPLAISKVNIAFPELSPTRIAQFDALLVPNGRAGQTYDIINAANNVCVPVIRVSQGPVQVPLSATSVPLSTSVAGSKGLFGSVPTTKLTSDVEKAGELLARYRMFDQPEIDEKVTEIGVEAKRKILLLIDDQASAPPEATVEMYDNLAASAFCVASDHDIIILTDGHQEQLPSTTICRSIPILKKLTTVNIVYRPAALRSVLRSVDLVYAVNAIEAIEAKLLDCEVQLFSQPDQAITTVFGTRPDASALDLFRLFYLETPYYLSPLSGEPCQFDDVLEWLELNRDVALGLDSSDNIDKNLETGLEGRIVEYQQQLRSVPFPTSGDLFLCNFAAWKRGFLSAVFPQNKLKFVKNDASVLSVDSDVKGSRSPAFIIWGRTSAPGIETISGRSNAPIYRVEDGFVRSIGLGANHILPYSFCLDSRGIYFDATKESDLEHILSTYDFASDHELMKEAEECLSILIKNDLTKYNFRFPEYPNGPYGEKNKKRVLVIGQVEDDASIIYGAPKGITNNDAVRLARSENPDAQIIYKIHPDVLEGKRGYYSDPSEVNSICEISTSPMSIGTALHEVDQVYAMTSLAGCEALLRGVPVVALGMPFYAGWGLTDDRMKNARRTRRLTLLELFAGAYLLYPSYLDPETGERLSLRQVMQIISEDLLRPM